MSTSFSANQYDNAFVSNKLGNWECPDNYAERPRSMSGSTRIIANDRGHLQEGVQRSGKNPWGNFVGTWDLPKKIPGNCAKVSTARTTYAQQRLMMATQDANEVLTGGRKNASRRVMREDTRSYPAQVDQPGSGRRSGADVPYTQSYSPYNPATPIGEYTYNRRTPTPQRQKAPTPDRYIYSPARSPIPTVPDIPEVLAMEAMPRECTPAARSPIGGLAAF